jgi:hypothetical protein
MACMPGLSTEWRQGWPMVWEDMKGSEVVRATIGFGALRLPQRKRLED